MMSNDPLRCARFLTAIMIQALTAGSLGLLASVATAQSPEGPLAQAAENPYRLEPFHADFPVPLVYPPRSGLEFEGTRRQILERLANNLQGNVTREAWQLATDFFWRAPEDAIEPLIATLDRALGNPALGDLVKNAAEAMGHMRRVEFVPALQRASLHKSDAVRHVAYASLAACADEETLLGMRRLFEVMDARGRQAWLQAVAARSPEHRVELLRAVMAARYPDVVVQEVMKEAVKLPPKEAAEIVRPRWDRCELVEKAVMAGVLHAAGDTVGTAWLNDALTGEDVSRLQMGLRCCVFGDDPAVLGSLREHVLRATSHLRPEVRLAAAQQMARLDGDDVVAAYEVLTSPDEPWEIRSVALQQLTRRGRGEAVAVMLEELPTATGMRLNELLGQLSASGDPRVVPYLEERFDKAPAGEGRRFLQSLAQNASPEAARALCRIFLGPERVVAVTNNNVLTTRSYLSTLLLNLRGSERVVLEVYGELGAEAWADRALLLGTLAGYAADRVGQVELQQLCVAPIRAALFDRQQPPQVRVLALNLLARKWMSVEDALRLKRERFEEKDGLRALFNDFLRENF